MAIFLSNPDLQVDFAAALLKLLETYLQSALFATVKSIDIAALDQNLAQLVAPPDLSLLASKGLRGEIVFSTPIVFRTNPFLLGYYRLLLGYSQKEFYHSRTGLGAFRSMEKKGILSLTCLSRLNELCQAMNNAASYLIKELSEFTLEKSFLDDLTLLTLGPQLRGGKNNAIGERGLLKVFEAIKRIVESHINSMSTSANEIKNAASRIVSINFAADPDIIIREKISVSNDEFRNIIAIEIKGGSDFSNIHNRIGEAEKSHQKAKAKGFTECWTIVNVRNFDQTKAKTESPSTNRFYSLASIESGTGEEFNDFANRIMALTGIPNEPSSSAKKMKKK